MIRQLVKQSAISLPFVFALAKRAEILAQRFSRRPHESDYGFFGSHAPKQGLFLDIGANTGQSALSFASVRPEWSIYSIEANPACWPYLRMTQRLLGKKHRILLAAASDSPGTLRMHVPRCGRFLYVQETTAMPETLAEDAAKNRIQRDFQIEQFDVKAIVADELQLQPDVVKIDVQGAELHVLRGLARTIEAARPVFMIENGPIMSAVEQYLVPFGYEPFGFNGQSLSSAWRDTLNVFFVPQAGKARAWCVGGHGQ